MGSGSMHVMMRALSTVACAGGWAITAALGTGSAWAMSFVVAQFWLGFQPLAPDLKEVQAKFTEVLFLMTGLGAVCGCLVGTCAGYLFLGEGRGVFAPFLTGFAFAAFGAIAGGLSGLAVVEFPGLPPW